MTRPASADWPNCASSCTLPWPMRVAASGAARDWMTRPATTAPALAANSDSSSRDSAASAGPKAHRPRAEGPPRTQICLAWFYTPGNRTWSHGGAKAGYTSFAFFNPRGDYAAVVLLNNGPDVASLADLLGDHIQQRLAGDPAVSLDTAFV